MKPVRAIIFDAYGTLYDVQASMKIRFEEMIPDQGDQVRELWRRKYHEYNLIRSLTHQYKNFWEVVDDALVYALHHYKIQLPKEHRKSILEEYYYVKPFDDVDEGLKILRDYPKAILSNGTVEMLNKMIVNSSLMSYFSHVISSDEVQLFKPHMKVYELAERKLTELREHILFISSNSWDVIGAKKYGFQTCWLNRTNGIFEELDCTADFEINELHEIRTIVSISKKAYDIS
jgi:2-haloacid dehalogenase